MILSSRRATIRRLALAALVLGCGIGNTPVLAGTGTTAAPIKVRMSIDENPIVPLLAESLGFLAREGVEIERVRIEDFAPNDFELQRPMRDGHIDVAYHWFNHAVFGARHGLPITAVMVFNDAPGMTVLVEASKAAAIRGPADFRGRAVASGAGYGTKSLITHALAARHGLAAADYRSVITASAGRQEKIVAGLGDRTVDIVTSEEPMTTALKSDGLALPLIDLTTRSSTQTALGAPWPAQSLLMSPTFMARKPVAAQRVVNAFVRTMRWINAHSAEEIAGRLPDSYFQDADRASRIAQIRATLPAFARGDWRVPPAGAKLVVDAIAAYGFDSSESGQWRARSTVPRVSPAMLYDNRLVQRAMAKGR